MENKIIKGILVQRNEEPVVVEFKGGTDTDTWRDIKKHMGLGDMDLIELIQMTEDGIMIHIDEEGRLKNKEYCRDLLQFGINSDIVGSFVVAKYNNDKEVYTSLSDKEIKEQLHIWRL